ncbi:hypothetical protein [Streptomyces sp. NPDC059378]|uniref:hypothetical protein n=1 Tax=Streptomyces sp. NPDC059378 TaxID=3346815 RepID=UPI00369C4F6B
MERKRGTKVSSEVSRDREHFKGVMGELEEFASSDTGRRLAARSAAGIRAASGK